MVCVLLLLICVLLVTCLLWWFCGFALLNVLILSLLVLYIGAWVVQWLRLISLWFCWALCFVGFGCGELFVICWVCFVFGFVWCVDSWPSMLGGLWGVWLGDLGFWCSGLLILVSWC